MSNAISSILDTQAELIQEIKSLRKENQELRQLLWALANYLCVFTFIKSSGLFESLHLIFHCKFTIYLVRSRKKKEKEIIFLKMSGFGKYWNFKCKKFTIPYLAQTFSQKSNFFGVIILFLYLYKTDGFCFAKKS